jgi:Tetratricopeptide repeat
VARPFTVGVVAYLYNEGEKASQVDIALAYRGVGDLTEAETRLRRVIATLERTNEPLWPRSILAFNGLAIVLFEKGQAEEAKGILLQVVAALADERGNAHSDTEVALQNLAAVIEQAPLTEDERDLLNRTGLLDSGEDQRVTVMKRIVQELGGDTDAAPGELMDARIALYELYVETGGRPRPDRQATRADHGRRSGDQSVRRAQRRHRPGQPGSARTAPPVRSHR